MKLILLKILTVLYLFTVSSFVIAETDEDGRFWLNLNAQGAMSNQSFGWYMEVQPRWREEGEAFDTLIIRPAIFYKLNDSSSLWLGYGNVQTHPAGQSTKTEHRLWQQYLHNFEPMHGIKLQSRTRFEQRRLEQASETGYKLRQMLRVTKAIEDAPSIYLAAWDEFFVYLNDTNWGAKQGFDQNRLFLGVGAKLNPSFVLEAGYLNQYVNTKHTNAMNHVLSTTLTLNF